MAEGSGPMKPRQPVVTRFTMSRCQFQPGKWPGKMRRARARHLPLLDSGRGFSLVPRPQCAGRTKIMQNKTGSGPKELIIYYLLMINGWKKQGLAMRRRKGIASRDLLRAPGLALLTLMRISSPLVRDCIVYFYSPSYPSLPAERDDS